MNHWWHVARNLITPQHLCGFLKINLLVTISLLCYPQMGRSQTQTTTSPASQKLSQMFSQEIQAAFSACQDEGGVNLGAKDDRDGSIICGNGNRAVSIQFQDYLNLMADYLAASFLIGVRTAYKSDPKAKPEQLTALAQSPNGQALLKQLLQKVVADLEFTSKNSTAGNNVLVEQLEKRVLPFLNNPTTLENLLGTSAQYKKAVKQFCTSPGLSPGQAKTQLADLNPVQLYAICFQEAGLADELEIQNRNSQPAPDGSSPQ